MADTQALWKHGVQRGLSGFWRERNWITALGALTGVFLLLQLMVFVLLGMQGFQQMLKEKTDLRLELQTEASEQDIQLFISTLGDLPYVDSSVYVTREQAYAQMRKQDPELIGFLDEFGFDNPFPETVAVTLKSLDDYQAFNEFIKQEQWQHVVDPGFLSDVTNQEQQIQVLLRLTRTGRSLAMLFLAVTGTILLFVTTELVRGRVLRRVEDVLVEHMSGAFTMSIVLPFAVEATVLLLLALALSIALTGVLIALLPIIAPDLGQQQSLLALQESVSSILRLRLPVIVLLELACLPIIGWLGAWLGIAPKVHAQSLISHRN